MATVDFFRRLTGAAWRALPARSKERHEPAPPPEELFDRQAGAIERASQVIRLIAAAVALNLVEFREELGQGGNAHDHESTRPDEPAEAGQGGSVIVKVLDHVEGQDGVECRVSDAPRTERARQVRLDQLPIGPIETLERLSRNIQPAGPIPTFLEGFEGHAPAAAGVQDSRGR